jgi:hypothetical protein
MTPNGPLVPVRACRENQSRDNVTVSANLRMNGPH